jgi:hypothetical protein
MPEDSVHQALECRGCIGQAKRHDKEFKVSLMCTEGCLFHISSMHPHLVVPVTQIKFGKEPCTPKFIQKSSTTGIGNLSLTVYWSRAR